MRVVAQRGDHVIRIDHFHIVRQRQMGGSDHGRASDIQRQHGFLLLEQLQGQALQIEQDLDDVFLHAFDGTVFVLNAVDFDIDHGCTRHRGQQDAAQRVAEGVTETAFQRLQHDLGTRGTDGLHSNAARRQKLIDL